MRELWQLASEALESGEQCVLATVVRLDGSGYGQPGSRLLLTESGERMGFISGGCLEKSLLRQAWSCTRHAPALLAFDTRGDAVSPGRYSTGCEGVVHVLCQRIASKEDLAFRVPYEAKINGRGAKLATIYASQSRDVQPGDAFVTWEDGSFERELHHEIADAKYSANIILSHLSVAEKSHVLEFRGPHGQRIAAAIEILRPPQDLILFGAGDDVMPVVMLALQHQWLTTVVGHRPELANTARFPGANIFCGPYHEVAADISFTSESAVVIMTHDFKADLLLVPQLLKTPVRSIGVLGPKLRIGRLVKNLYDRGQTITPEEAARIRSPIGLDIGAETPIEIATSIVAELIAMSHGRRGGTLHDCDQPLHERQVRQVIDIQNNSIPSCLNSAAGGISRSA